MLSPKRYSGALVSHAHMKKVCGYLALGKTDGVRVLLGGNTRDGKLVEPTILEVNDPDHALMKEEIFGPVLCVTTVQSFDTAIARANDTPYGLAASLFTANTKKAIRGARAIRAGTVTVNSFGEGDISTPFGDYKQSGFGGRDNSIHAHDQYTQLKTIWIDLSDNSETCVD